EVAPGLDRRQPAAGGSWWPYVALREEVRRAERQQEVTSCQPDKQKPSRERGFFVSGGGHSVPVLLEGCLQQTHLALHRVAGPWLIRRQRGRVDIGIQAANLIVELFGTIDQAAQPLRQKLDGIRVARLAGGELDLGLFLIGLDERHLALLDRTVQQ